MKMSLISLNQISQLAGHKINADTDKTLPEGDKWLRGIHFTSSSSVVCQHYLQIAERKFPQTCRKCPLGLRNVKKLNRFRLPCHFDIKSTSSYARNTVTQGFISYPRQFKEFWYFGETFLREDHRDVILCVVHVSCAFWWKSHGAGRRPIIASVHGMCRVNVRIKEKLLWERVEGRMLKGTKNDFETHEAGGWGGGGGRKGCYCSSPLNSDFQGQRCFFLWIRPNPSTHTATQSEPQSAFKATHGQTRSDGSLWASQAVMEYHIKKSVCLAVEVYQWRQWGKCGQSGISELRLHPLTPTLDEKNGALLKRLYSTQCAARSPETHRTLCCVVWDRARQTKVGRCTCDGLLFSSFLPTQPVFAFCATRVALVGCLQDKRAAKGLPCHCSHVFYCKVDHWLSGRCENPTKASATM